MITITGKNEFQESVLKEELQRRGYSVEVSKIVEAKADMDLGELIDKYIDDQKMYHFEGSRGVKYLKDIIMILDSQYRDFDEFFSDNQGAMEALIEWIKDAKVREWKENFQNLLDDVDDE
jgi:hypothetical protein